MRLAKQHLDVGLFTADASRQLVFWRQQAGLCFDHDLPVADGVHQYRFHSAGSIIKINHVERPLPPASTGGIRAVHLVAPTVPDRVELADPDGNRVVLVPPASNGMAGLAIEMAVSDFDAAVRFWGSTLGFPSPAPGDFLIGESLVMLRHGGRTASPAGRLLAPGWRYLTIQVEDCRAEHGLAVAMGAVEAIPPRDRGGVAIVSFIRDPDGNFIELAERMDLKAGRLTAR
jgi:lactoylglutathione lyase